MNEVCHQLLSKKSTFFLYAILCTDVCRTIPKRLKFKNNLYYSLESKYDASVVKSIKRALPKPENLILRFLMPLNISYIYNLGYEWLHGLKLCVLIIKGYNIPSE